MLILTRDINGVDNGHNSVVVRTSDGDITFYVLGFERGRVKVGVSAPSTVPVRRGELAP